jgi:Ni,Fe-hydrogenase III large subunit
VTCLLSKNGLYSAGSDGKVIKWEIQKPFINLVEIIIETFTISNFPKEICSFDISLSGSFVVGTLGGEIMLKKSNEADFAIIV